MQHVIESQDLGPRREGQREESDKEKLFKARQICLIRRQGREQRGTRQEETRGKESAD